MRIIVQGRDIQVDAWRHGGDNWNEEIKIRADMWDATVKAVLQRDVPKEFAGYAGGTDTVMGYINSEPPIRGAVLGFTEGRLKRLKAIASPIGDYVP